MIHQVLKRFSAEGKLLQPGELVETGHWKNWRLLLEHRFIGIPSAPQQNKAGVAPKSKVVAPVGETPSSKKAEEKVNVMPPALKKLGVKVVPSAKSG